MMCFHKGPLVLNYAVIWTLYFSHFFTGLYRICLCAKVHNLVIIVGIDCATDKSKRWMKAACSWMRDTLFCHQFSPQNAKNHILRLWSVKIFWGGMPPNPLAHHRKKGRTVPCWYSWLIYSNLPVTSIFIKTPDGKRGFFFKRTHYCCLLLLLNFLRCHINFSRCHYFGLLLWLKSDIFHVTAITYTVIH